MVCQVSHGKHIMRVREPAGIRAAASHFTYENAYLPADPKLAIGAKDPSGIAWIRLIPAQLAGAISKSVEAHESGAYVTGLSSETR